MVIHGMQINCNGKILMPILLQLITSIDINKLNSETASHFIDGLPKYFNNNNNNNNDNRLGYRHALCFNVICYNIVVINVFDTCS